MSRVFLQICFLLAILTGNLVAQEIGRPFIQNYSYKEYQADAQNWAVVTDKRGFIYVGNNSGVLEYDGVEWRLIPVDNQSEVRSLAVDSTGKVYVGAIGEFGYLEPDESGNMVYVSLSNRYLEEESARFNDVWASFGLKEGVFFYTDERIFRYTATDFTVWPADFGNYFLSYMINGRLFIHQENFGLTYLDDNDVMTLVNGGMEYIGSRIFFILPYNEELLIGTEKNGLYVLDTVTGFSRPLNLETNLALGNQLLYQGIQIRDNYVVGTQQGGIYLLDRDGNILQVLNKSNGLQDNSINGMTIDNDEGLWLATSNGVSRVEVVSDLTSWNEADGLSGSVLDIVRFNGSLYIATFSGIYIIQDNVPKKISGINEQSWKLFEFENPENNKKRLLAGTNSGLYEIIGNSSELVLSVNIVFDILQSKQKPNTIYLGTRQGLSALYYDLKKEDWAGRFESYFGINDRVRKIAENSEGDLWLPSIDKGIFYLDIDDDFLLSDIEKYGDESGFPSSKQLEIKKVGNELLFATPESVYYFDKSKKQFFEYNPISRFKVGATILEPQNDGQVVWIVNQQNRNQKISRLELGSNMPRQEEPFLRLPEMTIYDLYPDENGITWIGGTEGLFRHDSSIQRDYQEGLDVFIRRVSVGDNDSIIYDGNSEYADGNWKDDVLKKAKFKYFQNRLVFEYATPSFNSEGENRYKVFLEGRENSWSNWTSSNRREYDNLREGDYIFKVKAKNVFGNESDIASYSFTILAPWYRTALAYIIYIFFGIMIVVLIIWYNGKRLIEKNIELEKQVKARTKEISRQNELLESQKVEISKKADDLRLANESILDKSAEIEAQRDKLASNYEQLEDAMTELQHQKELVEQKSSKLEEAQNKLKRVNLILEQQVEERTKELNDAYHQLLEKNRELDMFVYRSAHDLKGPIARFLGLCYVGKMEIKDEVAIDYLKRLELTANEMNKMLGRLIRAHDINQKEVEYDRIGLKDTILGIFKNHTNKIDNEVKFDIDSVSDSLTIECDILLFNILLENLIQNSLKYQDIEKENRFIKVIAKDSDEKSLVRIEVIDNGVGIPVQVQDNIFNMFFIGNEKNGGHGLGLYEAKLVVEKLKGEILYEPVNGYTRFIVNLPFKNTEEKHSV